MRVPFDLISLPLLGLGLCGCPLGGADKGVLSSLRQAECGDSDFDLTDRLDSQLIELGYVDLDGELNSDPEVVTTQEEWAALVDRLSDAPPFTPDLEEVVVFVHPWSDNGCMDYPHYQAWLIEGTAYLEVRWGESDNCDMAIPMVDLLLVDRDEADDFGWCSDFY